MATLMFEFPSAACAQDFLDAVDGEGSRSHRVVEVQRCEDRGTARALARGLGGKEAP